MNEDTHQHLQYTGVMDAMRRILRTEGVPGFYRGMKMKVGAQEGRGQSPGGR